jgi:hypothetical protein
VEVTERVPELGGGVVLPVHQHGEHLQPVELALVERYSEAQRLALGGQQVYL